MENFKFFLKAEGLGGGGSQVPLFSSKSFFDDRKKKKESQLLFLTFPDFGGTHPLVTPPPLLYGPWYKSTHGNHNLTFFNLLFTLLDPNRPRFGDTIWAEHP